VRLSSAGSSVPCQASRVKDARSAPVAERAAGVCAWILITGSLPSDFEASRAYSLHLPARVMNAASGLFTSKQQTPIAREGEVRNGCITSNLPIRLRNSQGMN
jgi:hypothetical protein